MNHSNGPVSIEQKYAFLGTYLTSKVQLCLTGEAQEVSEDFDPSDADIKRFRVRTLPMLPVFSDRLNRLYSVMGEMFSKLPDLRRMYIDKFTDTFLMVHTTKEQHFNEYEEKANAGRLYSFLNLSHVYQSSDCVTLATECYDKFVQAHNQTIRTVSYTHLTLPTILLV